jgi:hypothetical protein
MKIRTAPVLAGMLTSLLVVAISYGIVSAESTSITDAQLNRIKTNCVSAKNTLNQIHASDALLRVNRGQLYESMSTKLMSRFNNRVDSNHYDAKNLISVTQNYGTALTNFRNDYQSYEEQLSNALSIDCTKEPVSFYDSVASSRVKRTQVHVDVTILHQYINDYESAYKDFAAIFFQAHGVNN